MSKIIMVSNRLPVRIVRKEGKREYQPSEGGLATGVGSLMQGNGDNIWIGWAGTSIDAADERGRFRPLP